MNWKLFAGWLLAVVATTAVAWQIVAIADDRVGESPVSPVNAEAPQDSGQTSTTIDPGASISTDTPNATPTTTTAAPTTSTTTQPVNTATTGGTSATTTAAGPPGASDEWSTKATVTSGGTVVVSYRPGEVVLETVIPGPGFQAEIEKRGPPVIEVELESNQGSIEVRARWKDGALEIDVDDSLDDEDESGDD